MVKKFSAPLERTARLLDLVPYINSHQGVSLKELSEIFDVSQSQMVNDLTTLWMCGLPGYTPLELMDLDFETGYVTINNAETLAKPRSVTFDEGVALVLGLDLVRSSIDAGRIDLLEKIDSLSERLSNLINMERKLSAQGILKIEVSGSLDTALKTQGGLRIEYHSLYRDEITSRDILPIEVIETDGHKYLIAYCYTANDFRHFRLERIQGASPIDVPKELPTSKRNAGKTSSTIKIIDPNRNLAERFNLEDVSPGLEFHFDSYSEQWMQRSILALGKGAELLAPEDLRKGICEIAQSMLDCYKPR